MYAEMGRLARGGVESPVGCKLESILAPFDSEECKKEDERGGVRS
jgi:hypothetical protein